MAGLVPFEPFGILTNFPHDEAATGEDMDWEFVNKSAADGQRYLRLHIQAKRAHLNRKVKSPYWEYRELDHGGRAVASSTPRSGSKIYAKQHKLLIEQAATTSGCVPLYMFYHPRSALDPRAGVLPAVEGLNWMFADRISVNLSRKRWPVDLRKMKKWRPYFHPLSDLLCFASQWGSRRRLSPGAFLAFFSMGGLISATPRELCERLNMIREEEGDQGRDQTPIRAVDEIPLSTLEAIAASREGRSTAHTGRPRTIFLSHPARSGPLG